MTSRVCKIPIHPDCHGFQDCWLCGKHDQGQFGIAGHQQLFCNGCWNLLVTLQSPAGQLALAFPEDAVQLMHQQHAVGEIWTVVRGLDRINKMRVAEALACGELRRMEEELDAADNIF